MSEHLSVVPPAAALMGREVLSADPATGEVRVRFFAPPEFSNRHGTVHGGLLGAMLDSTAGNAVLMHLTPDLTSVTTRLDTRFLKPAQLGELMARARMVERTDRDAVVDAEIRDHTGTLVATARAEFRIRIRRNAPRSVV